VSSVASKEPQSPPGEPRFRDFVTRLLRVSKSEIDEREKARKRRPPPQGGDKVKPLE